MKDFFVFQKTTLGLGIRYNEHECIFCVVLDDAYCQSVDVTECRQCYVEVIDAKVCVENGCCYDITASEDILSCYQKPDGMCRAIGCFLCSIPSHHYA